MIEDPQERAAALQNAWTLTEQVLVVAARLSLEAPPAGQRPYRDGFLTQLGTFQKYYDQQELRAWIDDVLGVSSLAAAPGIFMSSATRMPGSPLSRRAIGARPPRHASARATSCLSAIAIFLRR